MSSFASHASLYSESNKPVLPIIRTTDTEGSTYKYETRGGRRARRSNKKRRTMRRTNKNNRTKRSYRK